MGSKLFRIALFVVLSTFGAVLAGAPAQAAKPPVQSSLRNPILPLDATGDDSPDPWVFRADGKYWINYTSANQLIYRSAGKLGALGSAAERRIWPLPGQASPEDRNAELWAPETHKVNGKWYVYFTATTAGTGVKFHRMYVLESTTDSPAGPYEFKSELELPQPFTIDGTVFQLGGKTYMLYSGGPLFSPSSIYLIELLNPWTTTGPAIEVSSPEYGWEREGFPINEGPEVLIHGNKLNVIYSASFCDSGLYALGRVTVPKNANLLDEATWAGSKYPDPVFQTDAERGVFGPGHGSFFTSNGGKEFWNVYHATEQEGAGCFNGGARTTRVQRFTWNKDDTPNFGRPVSVTTDISAPKGDNTIAIQAESAKFSNPARSADLAERRFYGYAGKALTPASGKLPAMKFRLKRKKTRYQVYVRILGGPDLGRLSLIRPDGHKVTRRATRSDAGPIELNMGRMRLAKGQRLLRLRSTTPISLDQIRLQPVK
jgi:GH43 family beta-xylosidase